MIADQQEKNNLKAREGTIFVRLEKRLAEWEKTVLLPIPVY